MWSKDGLEFRGWERTQTSNVTCNIAMSSKIVCLFIFNCFLKFFLILSMLLVWGTSGWICNIWWTNQRCWVFFTEKKLLTAKRIISDSSRKANKTLCFQPNKFYLKKRRGLHFFCPLCFLSPTATNLYPLSRRYS